MKLIVVLVLAWGTAVFTYAYLERLGRRAWPAMACRGIAWTAIGLLALDLSCATRPGADARPLVLLDASLSLEAAGGHWRQALDSARVLGPVQLFGEGRRGADTVPFAGRSVLGPALALAAAADRQVLIVTDGEVDDVRQLSRETLARVGVLVLPRDTVEDLALADLSGPDRVTRGDTARFEMQVTSVRADRDTLRVEARVGSQVLARRTLRVAAGSRVAVTMEVPTVSLAPGTVQLEFRLSNPADAEPRDDARLWLLDVTETPGIVVLANPGDWDSRFLFRAIREVARLPVRGYVSLTPGSWRGMESLAPVRADEVALASRRADLLVVKGHAPEMVRGTRARAQWLWPSGEGGEAILPGEWYASAGPLSPLSNAFAGMPVDSFPPLTDITPIEPGPGDWVGITAQNGRRGADRPVMTGKITGSFRRVLTAADGLWRWAFRGGSSEQVYRSLVAATVSWLLAAPDTALGRARPARRVVERGRPVIFGWTGSDPPAPLSLTLSSGAGQQSDTLRFDGEGRAELWLPVGRYRYRLSGGGEGALAVEEYSSEFPPRPAVLASQPIPAVRPAGVTSAREWLWLFLAAILGLAGEWLVRRRLGLR